MKNAVWFEENLPLGATAPFEQFRWVRPALGALPQRESRAHNFTGNIIGILYRIIVRNIAMKGAQVVAGTSRKVDVEGHQASLASAPNCSIISSIGTVSPASTSLSAILYSVAWENSSSSYSTECRKRPCAGAVGPAADREPAARMEGISPIMR